MNKEKLKKLYIVIALIYVALAVAFYFLSGDQLKYRESENNIEILDAEGVSNNLTEGVTVEQRFINPIDRIDTLSFVCTTHYREHSGMMTVELLDGDNTLLKKEIDISTIEEQSVIYVYADEPIEDVKGHELVLRISADSSDDKSVALMISRIEGGSYKNGQYYSQGRLCFGVSGTDYIFTGTYYWHIMIVLGICLYVYLYISYKNYLNNKQDYLIRVINASIRYEFLIRQLVSRDFKSKYKRSFFGVLWSFLNPLLTMVVQFLVFSTIFKSDTVSYPVYLLSGTVCFNFFSEATSKCLGSISGNSNLITKVYIPKYIFPISGTLSSSINLLLSLLPLILVTLIMGLGLHSSFILMFYFLICLIVFSLGVGMFLATLMVFFRDIQFLWSVISMIWMYATPIFYPISIIPPKYNFVILLNPLFHFVKNVRICLIDGVSPEPINYVYCFIFAIGALLIGSFVFKKNQEKFTLYL